MACDCADVWELLAQLPEVATQERRDHHRLQVAGQTLGYLWPGTVTVGLRQMLAEQLALVAERPETFEVQFTAGAFGWVVVHLQRVRRDELAELVFEAWRLSAPAHLVAERADRLPR